jgi:glutathione S-transferase
MIVYKYGQAWGCADLSPFCVKLETWLRMAGLPYETRIADVRQMPKRKLPAAELDGQLVGDSALIIERLRVQHGDLLGDVALASDVQATARAMRAMVESELYFAGTYFRWADDKNWNLLQNELTAYAQRLGVPSLLAPLAAGTARRLIMRQLQEQGMGRHSPEEIATLGIECLQALSDYLGDKPYMLDAVPHTLDASVFAFLHVLLVPPFESPLKEFARGRANLVAYHDRVLARWWPELSAAQVSAAVA